MINLVYYDWRVQVNRVITLSYMMQLCRRFSLGFHFIVIKFDIGTVNKLIRKGVEMKRILLVKNELIIAMDMAQTLEGIGYDVEITQDGVEGMENINRKDYDLIIVDNNMPRMNGEEMYKEVFSSNEGLARKMMFVSAEITDFIRSTGNPSLVKPFSDEQLINAVKKMIA